MDGFQVVSRKKKGKRKDIVASDILMNSTVASDNISDTNLQRKVNLYRDSITCTDFYTDFKAKIKECLNKVTCIHHGETTESQPKNQLQYAVPVPDEIVSYGLGNFADCSIARYQLALLVALREDLQVPPNDILLYDPKFLSVEKDVLTSFGLQVLKENEEAKRCCERPTLFFMPHCGKSLYNNLLFANWSPDRLCHIVIIGNSFTNMVLNLPSSTLKRCAPLVMKIQPFTEEVVFPGNFQYQDVFNDTVIHVFSKDKLLSIAAEFWEDCPAPTYDEDDLEFIPKS